jgi:uncharacterized delta-60 repeat protein
MIMAKNKGFRAITFSVCAALIVGAGGCEVIAGLEDHNLVGAESQQDGSTDAPTSPGDGAQAPGFSIAMVPDVTLEQVGSLSAPVNITITRTGGFDEAISFAVSGLPASATSNPLTITSGATTGSITVSIGATTPQSVSHLSVNGVSADGKTSASAKFDLTVRGAPGSLDTQFGTNGIANITFPLTSILPEGLAVDANGNLLVIGSDGTPSVMALARVRTDGTLDPTFGDAGFKEQVFLPQGDFFTGVFPLASGDIMTTGAANGMYDVLARFTATGALDSTFSPDGGTGYYFDRTARTISRYALDSTGRLDGVGAAAGSNNFYLERHLATGALDPAFASGGAFTQAFGSATSNANGVRVTSDGKIVGMFTSTAGGIKGISLARFTDTGALDTSFGSGGYVAPVATTAVDGTIDLAVQSDNNIVAFGDLILSRQDVVARYLGTTGALDPAFGTGGVVTLPGDSLSAMASQADKKIVITGPAAFTDGSTVRGVQIFRFTSGGLLDDTFGDNGVVVTSFGTEQMNVEALAIQPDGRIVVAGILFTSGTTYNLFIARYWP